MNLELNCQIVVQFVETHRALLLWVGGSVTVVSLLISFIVLPYVLAILPPDYFAEGCRSPLRVTARHPTAVLLINIIRNVFGLFLFISGVLMLVLPGQGVLTILAGLIIANFPGKFTLERRLMSVQPVRRAANWIRGRLQKPPFDEP